MSTATAIDPEAWLGARGWIRYEGRAGVYWRRTPNEPGWEGGWNIGGAVHQQLERENRELLERMGLYRPPARAIRRAAKGQPPTGGQS